MPSYFFFAVAVRLWSNHLSCNPKSWM